MLAVEAWRWLARLPWLTRLGLLWLTAALGFDLLYHVAHDGGLLPPGLASIEYGAHVAVLIGMVLLYLGVVTHGVMTSRSKHKAGQQEGGK